MTRGSIREQVVAAKVETIEEMLRSIATLPLESEEAFLADPRMVAAGESFLRRALEALLDLGRHLLAKGFGIAAAEYKSIPQHLEESGVLSRDLAARLSEMAGYRNRLVHFYDEVTPAELYRILTGHLAGVTTIRQALRRWLEEHPQMVDRSL